MRLGVKSNCTFPFTPSETGHTLEKALRRAAARAEQKSTGILCVLFERVCPAEAPYFLAAMTSSATFFGTMA